MIQVAIQLPDDLNCFVQQSVQSGAYHDTDDFFVSVIATLKEQIESPFTEEEQAKLGSLRQDVQLAVEQLDRGEGIRELDWDEFIAARHQEFAAPPSA